MFSKLVSDMSTGILVLGYRQKSDGHDKRMAYFMLSVSNKVNFKSHKTFPLSKIFFFFQLQVFLNIFLDFL